MSTQRQNATTADARGLRGSKRRFQAYVIGLSEYAEVRKGRIDASTKAINMAPTNFACGHGVISTSPGACTQASSRGFMAVSAASVR